MFFDVSRRFEVLLPGRDDSGRKCSKKFQKDIDSTEVVG
jgi:hypothetical protein